MNVMAMNEARSFDWLEMTFSHRNGDTGSVAHLIYPQALRRSLPGSSIAAPDFEVRVLWFEPKAAPYYFRNPGHQIAAQSTTITMGPPRVSESPLKAKDWRQSSSQSLPPLAPLLAQRLEREGEVEFPINEECTYNQYHDYL
jgi:hypothetical protein